MRRRCNECDVVYRRANCDSGVVRCGGVVDAVSSRPSSTKRTETHRWYASTLRAPRDVVTLLASSTTSARNSSSAFAEDAGKA